MAGLPALSDLAAAGYSAGLSAKCELDEGAAHILHQIPAIFLANQAVVNNNVACWLAQLKKKTTENYSQFNELTKCFVNFEKLTPEA